MIVSGGNTTQQQNEAEVMKEYIIANDENATVVLEDKALDTRENILYIQEHIYNDKKQIIIIIEAHLFRVKFLPKMNGMGENYFVGSNTEKKLALFYNLRETVACVRDIVEWIFH